MLCVCNKKLILGFGLNNLVIVDTDDVVLIMDKSKDQEIKMLLEMMKSKNEYLKLVLKELKQGSFEFIT